MTAAVRRLNWRVVWLLALNAAIITVLVIVGITYVQGQTRKICGLIVLTDDRYQKLPPTADPDARAFGDQVHEYRKSIGCGPGDASTK